MIPVGRLAEDLAVRHPTKDGDTFERLLRGYVRFRVVAPLLEAYRAGTLEAELVSWPLERIRQIVPCHGRDRPRREDEPILVCTVGGLDLLVDGNGRRNLWAREGRDPCPVWHVEVP